MSALVNQPTPYAEVNALLRELLAGARAVLGDGLVGAYLFGSLAAGDFDRHSDIDVVVVTDGEVPDELFAALRAMHAGLAAIDSPWAVQLEVSYIPRRALRRHDPADAVHPHIDRGEGESLRMMRHESDWVVQRHTLRERGVALAGPPPATLIDPVTPDDLRRAMLEILGGWWATMLDDPAPLRRRGYQSYAVLSTCRLLYTLRHGAVVSKRAAARWACETLGERWTRLVERAVLGREDSQAEAGPEDVRETLALIRYALEDGRRFEMRGC